MWSATLHGLFALLVTQSPAPAWQFRDAAAHDGRSLLVFRPVELGAAPVRPFSEGERPPPNAKYSLLPVGTRPDVYPALVWLPDTGAVWIDGDGDGRYGPTERHQLGAGPLEVPIVLHVEKPGENPTLLKRTLILRRASDGGLRYAVRGYVTGTLRLSGQDYRALLSDGNADGCFDAAAHDRIWIDLDRDGRFDALAEQFPLGKPLTIGGKMYLLKPEPDGSSVHIRARPSATGTLRLAVTDRQDAAAQALSLTLVSDWGELVTVSTAKEPVSLPVARYAVDALRFQLADAKGSRWQYHFAGPRTFAIEVAAGTEKVVSLLTGLQLAVELNPAKRQVRPGQDIFVTPTMKTPGGLYLVNCEKTQRGEEYFTSGHADIRLVSAGGDTLAREQSSFL